MQLAFEAFIVGVGFFSGYYLVQISVNYLLLKAQLMAARKMAESKRQADPQKPKKTSGLCMKCKRNPRPKNGIHCKSCQFEGTDKMR